MSRPTFILLFSQVACLHESFKKKSVRVVRLLQEVGWRQMGPYGRSGESRRGEILSEKLASLVLELNKERIEKQVKV